MAEVRLGRRSIAVSNPDKPLWRDPAIPKLSLVEYYAAVASTMSGYIDGHMLTMERFPDGIDGKRFYQKDAPAYFPKWIPRKSVSKEGGGKVAHVVGGDPAVVVYLATQATISVHMSLDTATTLGKPDQIVFDLDPSDDDFSLVQRSALLAKELLEDIGLVPFVKTSGSRGLHLVVPIKGGATFKVAKPLALDVMTVLARRHPKDLTIEQRKDKREGRLFLDWLRNARSQTAVAPFSVRPLPGAPVAVTLDWDEALDKSFRPGSFSFEDAVERAENDPWKGWRRRARSLDRPREKLARILAEN